MRFAAVGGNDGPPHVVDHVRIGDLAVDPERVQLGNGAEVLIDKDDETTINAIRNAVKTDRKFPNRPAKPDADL